MLPERVRAAARQWLPIATDPTLPAAEKRYVITSLRSIARDDSTMPSPFPLPPLLAWSALARLVGAGMILLPLWAAVGWAVGWWR